MSPTHKLIRKAEMEMVSAQVLANRYMREATAHINNQALWECWQAAETRAKEARQRWNELKEEAMKQAA